MTLFKFNGANSIAQIPTLLTLEDSSFTKSFWVKLLESNFCVMGDYPNSTRMVIELRSGKLRHYRNAQPDAYIGTDLYNVGEWVHITYTRNTTTKALRVYVNGVFAAEGYDSGTNAEASGEYLTLGAYSNGDQKFQALMQDMKIWGSAKTDSEVTQIFNGRKVDEVGLLAHYRFNEGVGTTLVDYSGKGNNGTYVNPVWEEDSAPTGVPYKALIESGGDAYGLVSGTWSNLGPLPTDTFDRSNMIWMNGFSGLNETELTSLKTTLPTGKGHIRYYTGPRLYDPSDPLANPDLFIDGSGIMLLPFEGSSDDVAGNDVFVSGGTYVAGKIGTAVSIAGSSSINLGQILTDSKEFSISFWMRTTIRINYQGVLGEYVTRTGGFWLQTSSTGKLGMPRESSISGSDYTFSSADVCDGQWHHITVTKKLTSVKMYIDGSLDLDLASNTDWAISERDLYLGSLGTDLPRYFTGQFDQFRVFNREVTPAEVLTLYAEGS